MDQYFTYLYRTHSFHVCMLDASHNNIFSKPEYCFIQVKSELCYLDIYECKRLYRKGPIPDVNIGGRKRHFVYDDGCM